MKGDDSGSDSSVPCGTDSVSRRPRKTGQSTILRRGGHSLWSPKDLVWIPLFHSRVTLNNLPQWGFCCLPSRVTWVAHSRSWVHVSFLSCHVALLRCKPCLSVLSQSPTPWEEGLVVCRQGEATGTFSLQLRMWNMQEKVTCWEAPGGAALSETSWVPHYATCHVCLWGVGI